MSFRRDATIIGGCGRVGLPLGIALADRNTSVALFDIDAASVDMVMRGQMPFMETGAEPVFERVLREGRLMATTDPSVVAESENLVLVVGTPVDDHLNPEPQKVLTAVESLNPYLVDGQLLILRS